MTTKAISQKSAFLMTYTQDQIHAMRNVYRDWDEYDCFEELDMLPLLNPWVIATETGDIDAWDDDTWSLDVNTVDDILEEVQISVTFQLPSDSHIEWTAIFLPSLEIDDYFLTSITGFSDGDGDIEYFFDCKTNFLKPYELIKPKHHAHEIPFSEFMSKLDFLKTTPSDYWSVDVLGRGYLNQHYWASLVGKFIKAEEFGEHRMDILTHSECEAYRYSYQAWDPQGRIAKLNKTLRELERKNSSGLPDLNDASAELVCKER